jgi:Calx-beta domain-containing protein
MSTEVRLLLALLGLAAAAPLGATTLHIVDAQAGSTGPVVLAVPPDGRAYVAYSDAPTHGVNVARCADAACSSSSVRAIGAAGDVGSALAMAVGVDGFPVLAYADTTAGAIKVARCRDADCLGADIHVIDAGGTGEVAVAIGADGLPLLAYHAGGSLKAAHCAAADCAQATVSTLAPRGVGVALVISEGRGLIFEASTYIFAAGVFVYRCADVACTAHTFDSPNDRAVLPLPTYTSTDPTAALAAGVPFYSWHWTQSILWPFAGDVDAVSFGRCSDASCTAGGLGLQTVYNASRYTATAAQPNGNAWLAYSTDATRLRACTDAACTAYTETCALLNATVLSLAAAGDGRSLLAYRRSDGAVAVVHDVDQTTCAAPSITIEDVSVAEDADPPQAHVTVRLSAPGLAPAGAGVATVDGTAVVGTDYAAPGVLVLFAEGSTTATVTVPILDDSVDEGDETFAVSLSSPINAVIADGTAVVTIVDDDDARLVAGDAFTAEGASGPHDVFVPVRFETGSSAATVTVGYETYPITATAGSDYLASTGTLTFGPGATTAAATVAVLGDGAVELDETLGVRLLAPVNAGIADGEALVTIQDDDAPSLSSIELTHGTSLTADLAAQPGPAPDVDHYRVAQAPRASYEVTADAVSGDLSPGLVLELLAEDNATVLRSSAPVGTGGATALRWEHGLDSTHTNQTVRVRGASCGTACGADDTYRLRLRETTASVARFNNSATQVTVLLLQNATDQPLVVHAHFWSAAGQRIATADLGPIPPHGGTALNTGAVAALVGRSGSITVSHDGTYGALAGKAVAIEPGTGFTFDSPLEYKPR